MIKHLEWYYMSDHSDSFFLETSVKQMPLFLSWHPLLPMSRVVFWEVSWICHYPSCQHSIPDGPNADMSSQNI